MPVSSLTAAPPVLAAISFTRPPHRHLHVPDLAGSHALVFWLLRRRPARELKHLARSARSLNVAPRAHTPAQLHGICRLHVPPLREIEGERELSETLLAALAVTMHV